MQIQRALRKTVVVLHASLLALTLPAIAATVPGSTPGDFSVTSGGSANYRIPIQVPPGVAGMEPRLSLIYDSQSDNGSVGVGWSLSGLSSISRCSKVRVTDGESTPATYIASDRYCLNGQRLMLVAGTHGTPGAQYRTERESFSLVTAYGSAGNGPAYFVEKTKGGQTIEYGNSTDSRIVALGTTTARAWAQNKVSDNKGNYLTVSYNQDSATGSYYTNRIDYAGNASASPVLVPSASVQVSYQTRPDSETAYNAGSMVKMNQRVSNIKTYNGTTLVKNYQLVYDQSAHTSRSRLTTLTECDVAGNCLAPVAMTWPTVATTLTQPTAPVLQASYTGFYGNPINSYGDLYTDMQVGDFNGDGKMDYMWRTQAGWMIVYSTGTGFTSPTVALPAYVNGISTTPGQAYGSPTSGMPAQRPYIYFADFNGDGKMDIMWKPDSSGWMIAYSTGNGFTQPTAPAIAEYFTGFYPNAIYSYAQNVSDMQIGDFNGDGKLDYMWRAQAGWMIVYGTDAGFTAPVVALALTVNGIPTTPASSYGPPTSQVNSDQPYLFFGDFNGDGKMDMMWRPLGSDYRSGPSGWMVSYGTSTGMTQPTAATLPEYIPNLPSQPWSYSQRHGDMQIADFNGDGKMDFMWRDPSAGWVIAYGTDMGFTAPVVALPPSVNGISTLPTQLYNYSGFVAEMPYMYFADFNGDGKVDFMWRPNNSGINGFPSGWMISYSTGTGFTKPTAAVIPDVVSGLYAGGSISTFAQAYSDMQIGDFNGDGKLDYMWLHPQSGWIVAYGTDTGFTAPAIALPGTVNGYSATAAQGAGRLWSGATITSRHVYFADFNGDGKTDIFWQPQYSNTPWLLATAATGNDTVSNISKGPGANIGITYKPITDASVYSKDNTATYPVRDIIGPYHVVSNVASSNGVGGTNTTNYTYGGLKVERYTGVGLQGFRWLLGQDITTQIASYTEYRQDWPYTGMLAKAETRLAGAGNAGVLKRSTPTLACKIPQTGAACVIAQRCDQSANAAYCASAGASRYFTYTASSLDESWDLNGAAWPSYTTTSTFGLDPVDGHLYGDATQTTVTASDGSSKTSVFEYWPADTANWILGRVKKSTVTSVAP